MKAKEVVIKFGSAPKDCSIAVDGVVLKDVVGVRSSISMEEGPSILLQRIDPNGMDEIETVQLI